MNRGNEAGRYRRLRASGRSSRRGCEKLAVKINAARGGVLADKSFEHLVQANFVLSHQATGKRVYFTLLLGTQGELRGVPVQIRYSPNWWFQTVLNLLDRKQLSS